MQPGRLRRAGERAADLADGSSLTFACGEAAGASCIGGQPKRAPGAEIVACESVEWRLKAVSKPLGAASRTGAQSMGGNATNCFHTRFPVPGGGANRSASRGGFHVSIRIRIRVGVCVRIHSRSGIRIRIRVCIRVRIHSRIRICARICVPIQARGCNCNREASTTPARRLMT